MTDKLHPEEPESRFFVKVPYDIFGRVKPHAIAVYAAFGRYADHGTGETFVSVETVASFLGVNKKTVEAGIRELIRTKWMKRKRQGLNKPSVTTLRIPQKAVRQETPKNGALSDSFNRESKPDSRIFRNIISFEKASGE